LLDKIKIAQATNKWRDAATGGFQIGTERESHWLNYVKDTEKWIQPFGF
jgi:hypothetical protein